MKYDLCIIGGAGHVGLPFGVVAATKGIKTALFDLNKNSLEKISRGEFPFTEEGGEKELKLALKKKKLFVSDSPRVIKQSDMVLLVIGTPVDEYLSPDVSQIMKAIGAYLPYFKNGQILILRSTVYPGTSERIQKFLLKNRKKVDVVFCPERIVQGKAVKELKDLPQIVSGFNEKAVSKAEKFFKKITSRKIVNLKPIEAELAKLFCNAWRYIQFAAANQFFMIAKDHNLDYRAIYKGMKEDYSRMKDLPSPGFAAGPCLLKDTMQLSAFHNNRFFLGHSALLINEGLPNYVVNKLKEMGGLEDKTVGILGMAFKSEIDDIRDSLSYKLKKVAHLESKNVLCHDPYVKDASLSPLDTVLTESDIVILATPHAAYKKIKPEKYPDKKFIDIWHFWGN
ncbi:MAG: nucleotide sugar dehydrogenase [Candidatus Pacebacteria bacterium]|nr:nucleotide sugar dehydrogenase [Candidatus Paceibacterota bacterium]